MRIKKPEKPIDKTENNDDSLLDALCFVCGVSQRDKLYDRVKGLESAIREMLYGDIDTARTSAQEWWDDAEF